eukprot:2426752-Amphidinium_carterae.1
MGMQVVDGWSIGRHRHPSTLRYAECHKTVRPIGDMPGWANCNTVKCLLKLRPGRRGQDSMELKGRTPGGKTPGRSTKGGSKITRRTCPAT